MHHRITSERDFYSDLLGLHRSTVSVTRARFEANGDMFIWGRFTDAHGGVDGIRALIFVLRQRM